VTGDTGEDPTVRKTHLVCAAALFMLLGGCLGDKRTGRGAGEGGGGRPPAAEGEGEGEGEGGCACESDADCDDGDPCNGEERCDGRCRCLPGQGLDCGDPHECTEDLCGPAGCVHVPLHARCQGTEICVPESGGCVEAPACQSAEDCPADDPCQVPFCRPDTRTCSYTPFDGDGDGEPAIVCGGRDCDDSRPDVRPGVAEACNGRDDDCDGEVDEGLPGCGEEAGPRLLTDPSGRVAFFDGACGEVEDSFAAVLLQNGGDGDLVVDRIEIEEDDAVPELLLAYEVPRFRSGPRAGEKRTDILDEEVCPAARGFTLRPGEVCFVFVVHRCADDAPDTGRLVIRTNDPGMPEKVIRIEMLGGGPQITVIPPDTIVFEDVLQGDRATRSLVIRNTGGADLDIASIELVNNAAGDFDLRFSEASAHDQVPVTLAPLDEDDFLMVDVTYRPSRAGQDTGQVRVRSNDEARPEVIVDLVARSVFPCVQVVPLDVDFRQVLIGVSEEAAVEVTNCGNAALTVDRLEMTGGTSPDFSISVGLEGLNDACVRDRDEPCVGESVVEGNATKTFVVEYAPSGEGADGGRVALHTNVAGTEDVEVNLFGRGTGNVPPECLAEARIAGSQEWGTYEDEDNRLETIPLKTLELKATGSWDADGSIVAYRWTVLRRPDDSTARIAPHEGAAQATFFLDLAGEYVFELEVTDNFGATSDPACRVVVEAIPDEDIHIQLVWDTPADPDQTDRGFGAGSDVDLHLLYPLGDWFCAPEDTCYANPNPDWGAPFDRSDDPSLDINNTDGAGPENINLDRPENNRVYRVGVHYHEDHGYGPSFVTVRIFVQGVLRFELANKRLAGTDQFWDVGTIAWPSGHITPIDQVHDAPPPDSCDAG